MVVFVHRVVVNSVVGNQEGPATSGLQGHMGMYILHSTVLL